MNEMRSLFVKSTAWILLLNLWIAVNTAEKGHAISDSNSIVLHLDHVTTTTVNKSEHHSISNQDSYSTLLSSQIVNSTCQISAETNNDTALSEVFPTVASLFDNRIKAYLDRENYNSENFNNEALTRRHIELIERMEVKDEFDDDGGNIYNDRNEEFTCRLYLAESTIPHAGLGIFTGMPYPKNERLPFVGDVVIPLSPLERSTLISK